MEIIKGNVSEIKTLALGIGTTKGVDADTVAFAKRLSKRTGAVTANVEMAFDATVAAVYAMGICGKKAQARMKPADGNASFRNYLIDAVYRLDGDTLQRGAIYEMCE